MTQAQLNHEILALVRESTETELPLEPDTHLIRDLGLSSVEIMLLISDLEDHFDITISAAQLRHVQTIHDLTQLVTTEIRKR